jgi:hypothetical protein
MQSKKPWATIYVHEFKAQTMSYDSYASLKKDMLLLMGRSYDDRVRVTRTRRGEWGQWYEEWGRHPVTGKPIIIKSTWL